jgi:hypothetical protein
MTLIKVNQIRIKIISGLILFDRILSSLLKVFLSNSKNTVSIKFIFETMKAIKKNKDLFKISPNF